MPRTAMSGEIETTASSWTAKHILNFENARRFGGDIERSHKWSKSVKFISDTLHNQKTVFYSAGVHLIGRSQS